MPDSEFTRLSRLVSLLTLLQSKRLLTATELAQRFSVSTRTIYRDMRTLEQAGVPLVTLEGKGYTLLEGYRLPPILFTREEAIALLTAEKLTRQRTDAVTAEHCQTAMDKLRSALKRSDRDHLETLTPLIEVLDSARPFRYANAYEPLLTAISTHRWYICTTKLRNPAFPRFDRLNPLGCI
ncbi:DNA-binding transcriptional regulator [Siphonobacter sp. BAB-5405]|uniref:helix-turn-helix transcriptional regulator n=1 Tax=Siphonobacter sp. BAB-5405 TaxID=1864825 RepID=UPI000C809BD1|nr:HTH domain-containing protein [Siphonobacter sp. BAB-5405]PMD92489.1 DNA-binding transcriptional regulator [Siphonobacter sp. BAB-5405]